MNERLVWFDIYIYIYIGWHGNIHMQNQGVVMAPVVEGEMKR
jgi:hypothetical protein